ncbi:MAG: RNA polymerase sigma factor [Planctomycetota bacterium]|jgi:RNA polymerase sigma-70 factor (ECF subfamily)
MAEMIDNELLVGKFNRGDQAEGLDRTKAPFGPAVFETIVEQYSADIGALANRLLGWPGDVEDVSQEVFLAAYIGLRSFRGQCSLKSWLFAITINKCRTHRRRQLLRLKTFSRVAERHRPPSASAVCKNPTDVETLNRVRSAVAALPAKYREPVVLRYLQELPTDEIAQILGISQNALHVRLTRARRHLKENLSKQIEP